MRRLVIDASIAIKWVFFEDGYAAAMQLTRDAELLAPDLLLCECANAIWKRVRRGEYTISEAKAAAAVIEDADIEFFPAAPLLDRATELAVTMDHPAYDCFYLALAESERAPFVTVDERLIAKLRTAAALADIEVLTLAEAAAL